MKLNYVSILLGSGIYIVLGIIAMVLESGPGPRLWDSQPYWFWPHIGELYLTLTPVISGYIAGRMARQKGLIHGGLVAILAITLIPLINTAIGLYHLPLNIYEYLQLIYGMLLNGGILCTLSGLLGEYHINARIRSAKQSFIQDAQ